MCGCTYRQAVEMLPVAFVIMEESANGFPFFSITIKHVSPLGKNISSLLLSIIAVTPA